MTGFSATSHARVFRSPLLVLTHGSAGLQALRTAVALGAPAPAGLHVVAPVDVWLPWWSAGIVEVPRHVFDEERRQEARRLLAAARDEMPAELRLRAELLETSSEPHRLVTALVDRAAIDLVVIGECAQRGCPEARLARLLVRQSPVPVLVVPATAPGLEWPERIPAPAHVISDD
jgi:nucleotide-binding universal stress UspA family protein